MAAAGVVLMSEDKVDALHESLHKLEVLVARIDGKVDGLASQWASDRDHLGERIAAVDHRRRGTDATLEKAVDLLHDYPKPHHIDQLIEDVESLMAWRQRIIGIALGIGVGSGLLSGGIVAAILRATGGG